MAPTSDLFPEEVNASSTVWMVEPRRWPGSMRAPGQIAESLSLRQATLGGATSTIPGHDSAGEPQR